MRARSRAKGVISTIARAALCGTLLVAWSGSPSPAESTAAAVDRPASREARHPGVLHVQGQRFDLTQGRRDIPRPLRSRAGFDRRSQRYFVVLIDPDRFAGTGLQDLKDEVARRRGVFVQEVPVAGYIARLTFEARAFLANRPEVLAVEPYHPAFKLSSRLSDASASGSAPTSESLDLDVVLFQGEDSGSVRTAVALAGGSIEAASGDWLHVRVPVSELTALARIEAVRHVFRHAPELPQGEEASATLQAGAFLDGTKPYNAAGIDGGGGGVVGAVPQVLTVVDTGIQLDSGELSHSATVPGSPGPAHRKVRFYGTTNPYGGSGDLLGCEPTTHGHVVAVASLGAASTVPPSYGSPWPDFKDRLLDGVAPGAVLTTYDAQVGCGGFLNVGDVYSPPDGGSLVHAYGPMGSRTVNFSFGASTGTYNARAFEVDDFLHDHPDVALFASVGNGGPGPGTVISPANAKNVIAIGATYSGPHPSLDQDDRWDASAVGPATSSDRIAPLLMAPGADLPSADAEEYYWCATSDDDQDGPVECLPEEGGSGTSVASPSAAGAALLVRDYFQQGFYPDGSAADPLNAADRVFSVSGALIKALLVSSADWVGTGNDPGENLSVPYRFNNEQGYGRIRLDNTLKLGSWPAGPSGTIVHDGGIPAGVSDLSLPATVNAVAGETATATFDVVDASRELRVALAWFEDSGDLPLNDLSLVLVSPDPDGAGPGQPTEYPGNYFTDDNDRNDVLDPAEDCPGIDGTTGVLDASPWSLPGCENSVADAINTTEAVFLSPDADADGDADPDFNQVVAGTWTLRVVAAPGGTDAAQGFAVALSGGVTVDGTIVWSDDVYQCGRNVTFKVLETDDPADPGSGLTPAEVSSRVTVQVLEPDGTTVVDEESGFAISQPDPGVLLFESAPILLTPDGIAVPGNGLVEVKNGRIVKAIYEDETSGVPDLAGRHEARVPTECSFVTPGEVESLQVSGHNPGLKSLSIEYTPACDSDNHTIVFGPLDDVGVHGYSGQKCEIGRNGEATFDLGPGSIFFLVVGNDGVAVEGSYGRDGDGTERPEDLDDPSCAYTRDLTFRCD